MCRGSPLGPGKSISSARKKLGSSRGSRLYAPSARIHASAKALGTEICTEIGHPSAA